MTRDGLSHPVRMVCARHSTRLRNASSHDFSGSPQLFKAGERFELGIVTIELAGLFHNFRLRHPSEWRGFLCLVEQVDPIVLVAAGRVEHDRHRDRFSPPRQRGNRPARRLLDTRRESAGRIKSGETNRRACNLGVSGNETRLTYVFGVRTRSHFKFERLGAGRDGHQAGMMVRELRVSARQLQLPLECRSFRLASLSSPSCQYLA